MAVEPLRRAGYRKVGGLYLVSTTFLRLPAPEPLPVCQYCGTSVHLSRNISKIPVGLYKDHYIMIVGKHFYPTVDSFVEEAEHLGVSKRVPFVAKDIVLHRTKIYLAHPLAFKRDWGIFGYFIPDRVEQLFWASDPQAEKCRYTAVRIPDGDLDHSSWKEKKLRKIESL